MFKFCLSILRSIVNTKYRGQSLIELLVAISIGTILIGGSVTLMGVSLKSYAGIRKHLQANVLIRQTIEVIQTLARYDWHSIDNLTEASDYEISLFGNTWTISAGQETDTINDISYKRYFQVYDVLRDASGDISTSTSDTIDDPSTQKITVILEYDKHDNNYISSSSVSFYLTRSEDNKVLHQTDGWSGGSGQTGPISNPGNKFDTADSNINYASTTSIYMTTPTSTEATLTSSILDTGVTAGAGFNSLLWQGNLGTGGAVKFQIAFSDCANGATNYPTCDTGTWTYYGLTSQVDYYEFVSPYPMNDDSVAFPTTGSASPQNKRYIRYKVNLSTSSTTPQIDDIIINWSP